MPVSLRFCDLSLSSDGLYIGWEDRGVNENIGYRGWDDL